MDFTKIFALGGSTMLPLIIISIVAVALTLELIFINLRSHGNLKKAKENNTNFTSKDPIFLAITNKLPLEKKIDTLTFEVQKIERKTSILSIIASIAPLVGLLGTVLGMIKIFNVVSIQRSTNPLEALSGGISEALFATAGGLSIAIISGFAHHFLLSSLDSISDKATLYLNNNENLN